MVCEDLDWLPPQHALVRWWSGGTIHGRRRILFGGNDNWKGIWRNVVLFLFLFYESFLALVYHVKWTRARCVNNSNPTCNPTRQSHLGCLDCNRGTPIGLCSFLIETAQQLYGDIIQDSTIWFLKQSSCFTWVCKEVHIISTSRR